MSRKAAYLLLFASLSLATNRLCAQGCAQCRDNLQATPPAVQSAYRHAIELLAGAGAAVFVGGVALIRRYR